MSRGCCCFKVHIYFYHSLKSVHIQGFSGSYFTAFGWIRRDTPYLSVFSPNVGKYIPEKLRIRTIFLQCIFQVFSSHVSYCTDLIQCNVKIPLHNFALSKILSIPRTSKISEHDYYLMMKMNCFCGMADRRKAFSFISSRDHCQRSSLSQISDMP